MSIFSIIAAVFTLGRATPLPREKESHNDYELRGIKGEWTREEARRELQESIDRNQRENDIGAWWNP